MQMSIDQMILNLQEGMQLIRKEYYRICSNNESLNKLNDGLIKDKGELAKRIDELKKENITLKQEIIKGGELLEKNK